MKRVFLWLLLLAGTMTMLLVGLHEDSSIVETGIFSLLPEGERDSLVAAAQRQSRELFFRELLLLVSADDAKSADAATERAAAVLRSSGTLTLSAPGEAGGKLAQAYLPYRFRVLTPEDQAAMDTDVGQWFRNSLYIRLALPGAAGPMPVTLDPAGHLGRFLQTLPNPWPAMRFTGNWPARTFERREHRLIRAELVADASRTTVQEDIQQLIESARKAAADSCGNCELTWTGAVRFSASARQSAEDDIRRIGVLSGLGLLLLFFAVFRGPRALAYGLAPLLTAILTGAAACVWLFGQVHVLTLVFGTTLMGLVIDYVFHYLAHDWTSQEPGHTLRRVMPGMTMGMLTSVTAFAFLASAGFPALTQIAVFSAAGLLGGWLSVLLLLPALPGASQTQRGHLLHLIGRVKAPLPRPAIRIFMIALAIGLSVPGILRLQSDDDLRSLQQPPPNLIEEDARIRKLIGMNTSANFFLIEGRDLAERLEREHHLFLAAETQGIGLSRFVPPPDIQESNLRRFAALFYKDATDADGSRLSEFSFRNTVVDDLYREWQRELDTDNATADMMSGLHDSGLSGFEVSDGDRSALIARLPDLSENRARELAANMEGVRFVQPLKTLEDVLGETRERALVATALAYLLVLVGFTFRYGLRGAFAVLMPAALGATVALGLLGWIGWPLNVFSMMGLVLVLGIGADYSLFLKESKDAHRATLLAITLAAITTLLSFGLLLLSSTPALRGFGLTVGTGILATYLAATLFAASNQQGSST